MIPKFRLVDKVKKEIWNVESISWDFGVEVDFLHVDAFNDVGDIKTFSRQFELLQSTGLKDKNGVEIFEGDIIDKGYHNLSIENRIGCVEFNQGGDSDGWAHGDWLGWITNNNDSLLDVHEHCTVIGNKFENPELLEE